VVIYLAEKIIRWWYFTCKKPENVICDGILHVNMFHYFKIPYFTWTIFTKFTYNEYIGPYFFIARCSTIFVNDLPEIILHKSIHVAANWQPCKGAKCWQMHELNVSWNYNTSKLVYDKCFLKSHLSDIKYHMTLNTMFSVLYLSSSLGTF
jgi:hypothetical protein